MPMKFILNINSSNPEVAARVSAAIEEVVDECIKIDKFSTASLDVELGGRAFTKLTKSDGTPTTQR